MAINSSLLERILDVRECIDIGHDMRFDCYWEIKGSTKKRYMLSRKCIRCNYVSTRKMTKKEIKAMLILRITDNNEQIKDVYK